MNETRHTSLPWRADRDCGASDFLAVYDAQGSKLALVFAAENAAVFSAAPEMAKLLRETAKYLEAQGDGRKLHRDVMDLLERLDKP